MKELIELIDQYANWYWNSDFDEVNLIDDLRLSNNIYETAHSRILYKLLSAKKNDGYPFWKRFANIVNLNESINTVSPDGFWCEKYHIDLLVRLRFEGKYFAVIIENKVNYAVDQKQQIERYIKALVENNEYKEENIFVVYLTRCTSDDYPSEKSIAFDRREKLIERGLFKKISYENEIREWIKCITDDCVKSYKSQDCILFSALIQYSAFLNNLFDYNKKDIAMDEEIDKWMDFRNDTSLAEKESSIEEKVSLLKDLDRKLKNYLCRSITSELRKKNVEVKYENNYIVFNVKYEKYCLKGRFSFIKNFDGKGIWFGLDLKKGGQESFVSWVDGMVFEDKILEQIKKDIYERIRKKYIITKIDRPENFSVYVNGDNSPYYCWKYSENLDKAVEEIVEYCNLISTN